MKVENTSEENVIRCCLRNISAATYHQISSIAYILIVK